MPNLSTPQNLPMTITIAAFGSVKRLLLEGREHLRPELFQQVFSIGLTDV